MKQFFALVFLLCSIFFITNSVNAQTVDFEDLTLNAESFWNGSDGNGDFFSNGIAFSNNYTIGDGWSSWDGFAYSNITDTTAQGFDAQYNAITGIGVDGSEIYAVAYVSSFAANPPTITLNAEQVITGAYFTNNNYAYYSMSNGDGFAKKFTQDDWFKLTITGIDLQGEETGTVEFKLADGTNIVDTWTWVDLSGLGAVKQLTFTLSSTDTGDFGMNTPAYFCMDNFNDENSIDDSNDNSSCFIHTMKSEFISW